MEKLNIAKLLKDCPKGLELDCTMYENVEFDYIEQSPESAYPIHCLMKTNEGYNTLVFTHNGCNDRHPNAKCVIFPKGKTTWEGFQRPFKDGDVIFTHANCLNVGLSNTWISIFKENRNSGVATYVDYCNEGKDYYTYLEDKGLLCEIKDILLQRFATKAEKQKLFDAIKANGYKWNPDTKTLEKLEVSKFDITTLKPFESKVLVKEDKTDVWRPSFYGFFNQKNKRFYTATNTTWRMCIPYNEDTKHLTGTTNDCDEYFKTWE